MDMNALMNLDLIGLLQKMNTALSNLAAKMHLNELIIFAAAAVFALIVGFAGMHLAKILSSFALAGVGFLSGAELFNYLKLDLEWSWLAKVPDGFAYIVGLVLAIVLFILGWKKCLHVIFGIFAVCGYVVVSFYLPEKLLLAIGGAVLLGMIGISLVRFAYAALTSILGAFALVSVIGAMWPAATVFQLGTHAAAFWIAVVLAVVLFAVQLFTTRNYFAED